jgi:hypothetical protein
MGLTLAEMLDRLKAETHMSQNVAHGLNHQDALKNLLRRVQEELYVQHDWPRLVVSRDVPLLNGTRYYNYPADLAFETVNQAWVLYGTRWEPISYSITPDDFNVYNSDDDFRTFPPQKWEHYADGGLNQFQVWPIPSQSGTLRMRGRKALGPLVATSDVATLDGTLIVLYAAAEVLAQMKREDAQLKLQKAQQFLRMLKARQGGNKTEPFVMGGGAQRNVGRPGIDFIPPGYGSGS